MSEVEESNTTIFLPPGYNTPPEYQNLPFNENWMSAETYGLPFGMEAWAYENMSPGDYAMGLRYVPNDPPHPPIGQKFSIVRDWDGLVRLQFHLSDSDFFTLNSIDAKLVRKDFGPGGEVQAKFMPLINFQKRRWTMIWERKIVHRNVSPGIPASNGGVLDFVRHAVFRLAMQYNVPSSENDNTGKEFFFNWEREALIPNRGARELLFKDPRPVDTYMMRLCMAYYDLEIGLKENAKDYTPIQILAEFQAFAYKCKNLLVRQIADHGAYFEYKDKLKRGEYPTVPHSI